MGLIDHIERHLGPIQHGWSKDPDGHPMPFQIVACQGGLLDGVMAYVTLGLSRTPLAGNQPDKPIRHELVFLTKTGFEFPKLVPAILHQLGTEALDKNRAYLRGDVVGPRGRLFVTGDWEAVYFAQPVYFPDTFAVHHEADGSNVVFAWVVPISGPEAGFVRERGWSSFEDLLERVDPDLLDPTRPAIA